MLPQLAAQADLIVALTHLGIDEDIKLASQVPGIDIIVGGMSHSELEVPMKVGQTLIVHDGFYGRSVGLLKLSFTSQGPGAKYERVYFDSMLEPMAGKWVENTNYLSWLGAYKTQMAERMGMIIGTAASTMSNVKTKSSETEIGNYVCDILRESTGADVALLPAAFFRGVLPEGPLTLGDLFTALPYDHYAVVLNVTGGELQEILGDAAKQIGRPGFPQVSGVSFGIVRGKAWQVRVAGQEIDPFASYRLVTTDALADGAHGYATMGTVSDRRYTGRLVRDLVRERLAAGQVASSTLYSRIAFLAQEPVYATPPPPAATSPPPVATPPPLPGEPPASADIPGPGEDEPASLDEPPAPANGGESEMDITRYDRTGQPLVVIEEEIVTDPASQIEDTPQPPPPPASTPDDAPAGETPSPPSQPDQGTAGAPADDPASDALGRARDNQNGLDYDFSLARTPEGYEYRLSITNNTGAASTLDYATGERFDFIIYSGSDMVWNYNYNRFFSQAQSAEPLAPGEVITFSGKWNGMGMDSELLSGQNYHFEAVHQLMDNPVRLAFDAPL